MSAHDKNWRYTTAEETKKPGYLKRKFDRIRAEQKANAEEAKDKVKPIVRAKVAA
jgi:hypothetical protein